MLMMPAAAVASIAAWTFGSKMKVPQLLLITRTLTP